MILAVFRVYSKPATFVPFKLCTLHVESPNDTGSLLLIRPLLLLFLISRVLLFSPSFDQLTDAFFGLLIQRPKHIP